MTTIREVARYAGVSPITVSRVINGAGPVNPDTRQRVEQAIADLHYVPNLLARSFRSRRTETLALVVTDITNPFWTRVARGVEDTARRAGYSMIVCNTDENEEIQNENLRVLLQKQVDGILLVARHANAAPVELIQRQGVAVVALDRAICGCEVDTVRGDSHGGAFQLTNLLLELGHKRIALLSGPADVPTAAERIAGYLQALKNAGLDGEARVIVGEYSYASGMQMARQALALDPRPTALFGGNNLIAMGALRAVQEAGLRLPSDLSLVCFDDNPIELVIEPFFTSANQPAYELGQRAARLLLDRLCGAAPAGAQEIILPVSLAVRRSSGPPPVSS